MSDAAAPLERLQRAVELFLQRQSGGAACSDDEWLAQHDELRDLLEPMLVDGADPAASEPESSPGFRPGAHLGDYRLIREVGRGGMGVVYEAEQVSLARRVALKVLPAHLTLSAQQIECFRREAAAAARLRHRAIIPIYGVGEAQGTHFFAMEFVDGENLRSHLDAVFAGERSSLGLAPDTSWGGEAAELCARVAEALDYAHQNGVIHRDVKPHNIMIDRDGNVLLVDFGLARDLDRGIQSRSGFAGTLDYASPEQVGGGRDLDHRTDVFSLGVVLYEMLARRRPFGGEDDSQLMRAVLGEEPTAVRRCNSRVARELETICHKALEKSPARRYCTAGEMAADLRRFLRHEPIEANPPSAITRVSKLVRRRGAPVAAVVLAALVLVGVVAFTLHSAHQERQRREAIASARSALDQVQAAWQQSGAPRDEAGRQHYRRQLAAAIDVYERLLAQEPSDHELGYESARAHGRAGKLLIEMGAAADAISEHDRVVELLTALAGGRALDERDEVARCAAVYNRSQARSMTGDVGGAAADRADAVAGFERLASSAADPVVRRRAQVHVAGTLTTSASVILDRVPPDIASAERLLERSIEIWARLPAALRTKESISLRLMCLALRRRNDYDAALRFGNRAIDAAERLMAGDPADPAARAQLAEAVHDTASVHESRGDDAQAGQGYRRALELRGRLARDFPASRRHRHRAALACLRLSRVEARAQRGDDAHDALDRGDAWLSSSIADEPSHSELELSAQLAEMRTSLAVADPGMAPADVIAVFDEAMVRRQRIASQRRDAGDRSMLGALASNLGQWQLGRGEAAAAEALARTAIEHQGAALFSDRNNTRYRSFMRNHYTVLFGALETLGHHGAMMDEADRFASRHGDGAAALWTALEAQARAAGLVRGDPGLTDGDRRRLAVEYGRRAVVWLERMVESGWTNANMLQRAKPLAQLRALEPVRAYLRTLQ